MSRTKTRMLVAFTSLLAIATHTTTQAESLEGAALETYNAYCPVGNYRAVWAEPLLGILEGWVNLVCLNEDEQGTSHWYVTPENRVVSPEDANLPVYVRPMAESYLIAQIDQLDDNDTIKLLLDFNYDEPDVPSLEFYGYPGGSYGSSGSATTGANGSIESSYQINGEDVTAAEYQEWETLFRAASRAQDAERDRLTLQQVHLALYDLVELNQWHDWVDVEAVNNGHTANPRWDYKTSLFVTLNGMQARRLLQTSEELVYVSLYVEPSVTDDGGTTDFPTELAGEEAQSELLIDDDIQLNSSGVSGGAVHPVALMGLLIFGLCGGYRKVITTGLSH